jgi:CDP-paratose 2-epimerase
MNILITGSNGLIGSEAVLYFDARGHHIIGVDNNMRRVFFGEEGDTTWNLRRLQATTTNFRHINLDIRDREAVFQLFSHRTLDLIIHCAAQPSHDKAKEIPLVDFDVNAVGTVNLLEATRQYSPNAVFVLMSTNKVYGDAPNELEIQELETRFDYAHPADYQGVTEKCRIDQSLHSIFGASKVAADIMTQEYGRYFGLKTGVFRGGCLTGSAHSGVRLHGFLSYLVKTAVTGRVYTIYGYKGKQVRDQIHSYDVIKAIEEFAKDPRPGEVYNLGGGRSNSASILEVIRLIDQIGGYKLRWEYDERHRMGDHVCYITDMSKFRSHYPQWSIRYSLDQIVSEMIVAEQKRLNQ